MFEYSPNMFERGNSPIGCQFLVRCLPSGSKVLTPVSSEAAPRNDDRIGVWSRIKRWFGAEPSTPLEVASIAPGTRLLVQDLPAHLQQTFGIGSVEEGTFVQLSQDACSHPDAIRFDNGQTILLQRLEEGQLLSMTALPQVAD
jgi:hypothetical protein